MYNATTKSEKRLYRCRLLYATEIARHTSAIVSTLSPESRSTEIEHAITAFEHWHGRGDLSHFLTLLIDRLRSSGYIDHADAVWRRLPNVSENSASPRAGATVAGERGRLRLSASHAADVAPNDDLSSAAG
jgi:hypothetical protein